MTASLTGLPVSLAQIAASTACGRGVPFDPNPPPTWWETTRTRSASRPSASASVWAARHAPWVESYSVSRWSSQMATVACGSIALLCSAGVMYVRSTTIAAPASAASTSPSAVSVGKFGLTFSGAYRPGWSARRTTSWLERVVPDAHQPGRLLGRLQLVRDHGRDNLAAVGNVGGLQDGELTSRGELRGVTVVEHGHHPSRARASPAST